MQVGGRDRCCTSHSRARSTTDVGSGRGVLRLLDTDHAVRFGLVTLRDTLAAPLALQYVGAKGSSQPAQAALRAGRAELAASLPPGYRVRISGAAVNLPNLPWLAVLDRDVTNTARDGLYVVYLFTLDLQGVYLSMNQGVTAHKKYFQSQGSKRPGVAARERLAWESQELRAALGGLVEDLAAEITLGGEGFYADGYEAGNVAGLRYDTANLPAEAELHRHLGRFLDIYQRTIAARNQLILAHPDRFGTSTDRNPAELAEPVDPPPQFRPKDASDYTANVPAQVQKRSRKHEHLVARFGEHVRTLGFTAATNVHPRDIVVTRQAAEHLVEAKTVGTNAEHAVREALGQLYSYRYFYYTCRGKPSPTLVALFSEPVGEAFLDLLQQVGVQVVWWEAGEWRATPGVKALAG